MQTNKVPHYDSIDNPTGCCPRFNPRGWDGKDLVRARGAEPGRVDFYYTTCPKCAKVYGKNDVVGVAEI